MTYLKFHLNLPGANELMTPYSQAYFAQTLTTSTTVTKQPGTEICVDLCASVWLSSQANL